MPAPNAVIYPLKTMLGGLWSAPAEHQLEGHRLCTAAPVDACFDVAL